MFGLNKKRQINYNILNMNPVLHLFNQNGRLIVRVKFWIILQLLALVFFSIKTYIVGKYLVAINFDFQLARNLYFYSDNIIDGGAGSFAIYSWIFSSISLLNVIFLFIKAINGIKIKKLDKLLFLMFLLSEFSTGGRTIIYNLIIFVLIVFLLFPMTGIRRILTYVSVLILLALPVFISRSSERGFLNFLYLYLVGPVHFFSEIIQNHELKQLPIRFGMSIMSVDWLFYGFFSKLGLTNKESLYTITNYLINNGMEIGNGVTINAFPSGLFYFYMDLGILGVGIMMFIFGYLFKIAYSNKRTTIGKISTFLISWLLIDLLRTNLIGNVWFLSMIIISVFLIIRKLKITNNSYSLTDTVA
jgi:oligosaccharide repeat unit polymerase